MPTSDYAITTGTTTADRSDPVLRRYGALCLAGGVIAAAGAIWSSTVDPVVSSDRTSYPFSPSGFRATEVIWTLTHVLTFFGALALVRADFAGRGRLARIGGPLTLVGMALLVPCELAFVTVANSAEDSGVAQTLDALIGVVALAAGIGFTLLGIAVVREHRWAGWARWLPLVVGGYELAVLTPAAPLNNVAFLLCIAGWNVCLAVLGLALARPAG